MRTQAKEGALTLRLGVRKYVLPFETRLLASDEYVFVHIPPSAELMAIEEKGLVVVEDAAVAEKAVASFRRTRKRGAQKQAGVPELPAEVANALSRIPAGFKIGYDPDGTPRLIRTRKRGKKGE